MHFGEMHDIEHHPVIILIIYSFGLCLIFVFFIIYKIYNKRKKKKSVFFLDKMMNKAPSNKEILLGSVLDFIANLFFNSDSSEESYYLNFWPSNLLLIVLFSLCLLKMKLYKHHYLSIIVIIIIGIVDNVISGSFDLDILLTDYKWKIIYFFAEGTVSVLYVLIYIQFYFFKD